MMPIPEKVLNFIGGKFLEANSGQVLEGIEPSSGRVITQVTSSDSLDVDQAVVAAEEAFPVWSQAPVDHRARVLEAISEGIVSRLSEFAFLESVDSGKPLTLARELEIPRAAENFRFFASAIRQFSSEFHSGTSDVLNYTLRKPLGLVGCISPWNLPLYLFSWKIAPALAAGNVVIAKPSELSPLTAMLLGEVVQEAGLPPGALNILQGTGARVGEAIVRHKKIKAISFTGGTATGARIAELAAPQFKKVSLELGGKNAAIVFADADLDRAIQTLLKASFQNQGQICLASSRILIESSIYESFRERFVSAVKALVVGDPLEPETYQGALISSDHQKKVLAAIEEARHAGARILCGGQAARLSGRCEQGYFVQPTVIDNLVFESRLHRDEIFGPVVILESFEQESEAVERANDTPYGLAGMLFTESLSKAHRVAAQLDTGLVWVNTWLLRDLRTPFGGVKNSGVGREGGFEALRFFTDTQNICIKLS